MTNRLAIIIALLIIGFFVLDHYVLGLNVGLFLTRKGLALLSWIAFWR